MTDENSSKSKRNGVRTSPFAAPPDSKDQERNADRADEADTLQADDDSLAGEASPERAQESDSLNDRIRTLESQLESITLKYAERLIAEALQAAYAAQGGRPSAAATAVLAMRAAAGDSIRLDPAGNLIFQKPDGSPLTDDDGVRHTAESYVRNWLAANPIFLGGEQKSGSGASPSESADPSPEEILRRIRSARTPDEILRLASSLGLK